MLENIQLFLQILYVALGITITAITFVIPWIKNRKAKKILQTTVDIASQLRPFIIEAEKFTNYTGEEKLNYVMTRANQYAIANSLKFDAEATKKEIEDLIELSKKVNKRDKDEVQTIELETVELTSE